MKKVLFISLGVLFQIIVWFSWFFIHSRFVQDIIEKIAGKPSITNTGTAARPYMLLYFFIILILTEIIAALTIKYSNIKSGFGLAGGGIMVFLNILTFIVICLKFVAHYSVLSSY